MLQHARPMTNRALDPPSDAVRACTMRHGFDQPPTTHMLGKAWKGPGKGGKGLISRLIYMSFIGRRAKSSSETVPAIYPCWVKF